MAAQSARPHDCRRSKSPRAIRVADKAVRLAEDKDGLSWQSVPTVLQEMMRDKDPRKGLTQRMPYVTFR